MHPKIKVATLNFSGINNSPFQYHDGSEQKIKLDNIFHKCLQDSGIYDGPKFAWNHGKVDKVMQKQRYSPAYRSDVGVVRGKFVNEEEFTLIWYYDFERNQNLFKDNPVTPEEAERVRLFDWLLYKSLIIFIYKSFDASELKKLDPTPYKQFLGKIHSAAYLNEQSKKKCVKNFIQGQSLDALFVQEAGFDSWDPFIPHGYNYKKKDHALIIYKKYVLKEDVSEQFQTKFKDKLFFNKDSVHLLTKRHLLISVHLTSKANNVQQAADMFNVLNQIHTYSPDLQIVVGIDANHYLGPHQGFLIYPTSDKEITTAKKRTFMQLQYNKSNKLVQETKDYIISTGQLSKVRIMKIDGTETNSNDLLPTNAHPYDHFLVMASVEISSALFSPSKHMKEAYGVNTPPKKFDKTD